MGNLCSSGTDRTDKKDLTVPDKPREGEGEALLATAGGEVGVGPEGVQVTVEGEEGGGSNVGGFGGLLSGAVTSGEAAFSRVSTAAEDEIQRTSAAAVESGKDAATKIVEDVKTSATAAVSETAANVATAAEKAVTQGVEGIERKAAEGYQVAAGKLDNVVAGVTNQVGAAKSEAEVLRNEAVNVKDSVESSATSAIQNINSSAVSAAESANTQLETVSFERLSGLQSAALRSGPELGAEQVTEASAQASRGIFGDVRAELDKKAGEAKASAELMADDIKQTAENKANEAVESARQSASETVASWSETVNQNVNELTGSVSGATQAAPTSLDAAGDIPETVDATSEEQPSVSDRGQNVNQGSKFGVFDSLPSSQKVFGDIEQSFVSQAQKAEQSFGSVKNTAVESLNTAKSDLEQSASEQFENFQQSASQQVENLQQSASQKLENFQQSAAQEVESLQQSASQKLENAQQSASQEVENVQQLASQKLESFQQSASQEVENVQQSASQKLESFQQSASREVENVQQSASQKLESFQQSASQEVENVHQSADGIAGRAEESAISSQAAFDQNLDGVRGYVRDVTSAAAQELQREAAETVTSLQDTASAEQDDALAQIGNVQQNLTQAGHEITSVEGFESQESSKEPQGETSSLLSSIESAATAAVQSGSEYIKNTVGGFVGGLVGGTKTGEGEGSRATSFEAGEQPATQPSSTSVADGDFLDKARSLLETQRNSIDGSRPPVPSVSITDEDAEAIVDNAEQAADVENANHEATAREFVESIIEKATSLVSESLAQNEPASEASTPSDPCVERGEETLAPKKRGVMFVSPQMSEKSSSSLSSPQEISPPPPNESDLSPPGESSSSSISQSDLVESDELLIPPSLPVDFSINESNNNNNNNTIINNNVEDDDESIQRIAMEVTAKAVQDAIKIVSENGTGSVLNSDVLGNDLGVNSPSSLENEEDELTTTDSSQVERGSPVSDITDTSAHGSVSESLSSYDPGAAFRQDVANLADLAVAPADSNTSDEPPAALSSRGASRPTSKDVDLINFEDGTSSETPTPTNTAVNDTYAHPPPQTCGDDQPTNPPPPFSSEVPSSLPSFDDLPSSGKPTIVINSPEY